MSTSFINSSFYFWDFFIIILIATNDYVFKHKAEITNEKAPFPKMELYLK
jgi:hypothetical protein